MTWSSVSADVLFYVSCTIDGAGGGCLKKDGSRDAQSEFSINKDCLYGMILCVIIKETFCSETD